MIDAMEWLPIQKGEPGYENRFRNRPISGGRDLPCFRPERLPELHSPSPAGGHCGTVHGCPLCLALPVGDLRISGHRSGTFIPVMEAAELWMATIFPTFS